MKIKMTREFIEKLPKTDLHVHLDGSGAIDTIIGSCQAKQHKNSHLWTTRKNYVT
jgi:adenosine deaminase